jgi:hypothetical protein
MYGFCAGNDSVFLYLMLMFGFCFRKIVKFDGAQKKQEEHANERQRWVKAGASRQQVQQVRVGQPQHCDNLKNGNLENANLDKSNMKTSTSKLITLICQPLKCDYIEFMNLK